MSASTPPPTRGFVGRRRPRQPDRLPPGQYDVGRDWPVLTAEVTPVLDPQRWTMTVDGLVATPTTWTWDEAHALPQSEYAGDIHCVTTWSKFGTRFSGAPRSNHLCRRRTDILGAAVSRFSDV